MRSFWEWKKHLLERTILLDEFIDGIDGIDSDMILTVQQDTVLCCHLNIDLWKHFAYVGAPWAHRVWGCSWEQNCNCMRDLWRTNAPKCNGIDNYLAEESMSHIFALLVTGVFRAMEAYLSEIEVGLSKRFVVVGLSFQD